jgi:hypothetical protein
MRYNMAHSSDGRGTVVILGDDGSSDLITDSHPNYLRIAKALLDGEDPSEWLNANPRSIVVALSDRVEVVDGVLHFDGDPVYDGLASTIERYHREGRDATNLVRFMERLSANPSKRSREQLFNWTQAKELVIDTDGYIIGFKGVSQDLLSISSGTALVNGVEVEGQIPNLVGTVISMPRSEVQDDPNIGCSTGLHVGSWDYASSFGQVTLEVRIDPANVVSVPADCGFQKLRCCEYTVIAVHDDPTDDLSDYEPDSEWDEDEAFDSFVEYVPQGFLDRLRDRILGRDKR